MSNKRPKKRSHVWEHFEETPDRKKATCRHCGSSLSAQSTGGTSHLKRHIDICSRDRDPAPGNKVRKLAITDDKSWEVEVKKAVLAEIPFARSHCKNAYYSLNWPIKMDIEESIYAFYEGEKEILVTDFENITSKVSFTIGIMEAKYFSITAHFINNDFNLVHKLIGFKKIADGPSRTSIASVIQSCISGWKLGERIFMLTYNENEFDFCLALNAGFRFIHACCKKIIVFLFSYILFDLFHLEHDKIVRSIDSNKSKLDKLNQISKEQGLPPINVDLFMGLHSADYSSIVRVIEYTFLYKEVFRQYAPREGGQMYLSDINWERVELLLNTCKLVDDGIKRLSSFKKPSLHLLIQYLLEIRDSIFNTKIGSISHVLQGGNNFSLDDYDSQLQEYINIGFNKIHYAACVLDPRCKLFPFEYIKEIGQLGITKWIRERVHGGLKELFGEYAKEETNHTSPLQIGITGTTNTQDEDSSINSAHPACHVQNANSFAMYMLQKQKMKPKTSELDEYLSEKLVEGTDEDFDLLAWWKENKSRYPVLSRMARDILAVPAAVYKVNEHITTDLRRLEGVEPQLVEAVICSKDWIISSSQSDLEPKN